MSTQRWLGERIGVVSGAGSQLGADQIPAVDVGDGAASEMLSRLARGVSAFPETLRLQLGLASVALGAIVDDAATADSSGFTVT